MFSFRSRPPAPPPPVATALIAPVDAGVDLSPFMVHDGASIAAALQALIDEGETVCFHGADAGVPGRIVRLFPQEKRFVVAAVARTLPQPGTMCCVAMPDGVKVQFQSRLEWQRGRGDACEAHGDWPEAIAHVQRRGSPRLDVPVGLALRADFKWLGGTRTFSVDDLSLGGIGLRGSVADAQGIIEGQGLQRVHLMQGERLALVVDLEVRSCWNFRSFLAGKQVHLGCRFVGLAEASEPELRRLLAGFERGGMP